MRENITKASVLEKLKIVHESGNVKVHYDGSPIGSIVRYGKSVGFSRQKVKSVYGSRIYGKIGDVYLSIEEEAGSPNVVLDKVASAIARKLKAAKTNEQAAQEEDEPPSPRP